MAKYYYTPFQYTDANERRTWNYYAVKGATFARCTSPCDVNRMTPEELGTMLVNDGLGSGKVNIRLLVCYGAGPSPIDEDYEPWRTTSGGNSIAKKLAVDLGNKLKMKFKLKETELVPLRVAGYQGPTHTGSEQGTLVKPKGAKSEEKVKAKQPFVWEDSDKPAFEQYIESYERASKSYIIWYDTRGQIQEKHPTSAGAAAAGAGGGAPLSALGDGDTLLVMAHGFWKDGGAIGPFAGPFGRSNMSMEVLRADRGKGLQDKREIIQKTWKSS